jgi:aminopeptidase N
MRCLSFLLLLLPFNALHALEYQLDLHLDVEARALIGTLNIENTHALTLHKDGAYELAMQGQTVAARLDLPPGRHQLNYRYALENIDTFSLLGGWYPYPETLAHYDLRLRLPADFLAVSEADSIEVSSAGDNNIFHFVFPHVRDSLSLIVSRHYTRTQAHYAGRAQAIEIETYLLPDNGHLAEVYLERAQAYLSLYEDMLTPYPYQRFAIVENPQPTGYAMPSFTLLGSQVVRLPFILDTSLGHEILHQWFGGLVYIDSGHGNWGEGLTHYLAEHWYAGQKGEDAAFRKNILSDYAAYAHTTPLTVRAFRTRRDKSESVVGYGKSAMIFHSLRQGLGDEAFFSALREFIQANRFRAASWHDLQRAFEGVGENDLYGFFQQWLTRADIPQIQITRAAQLRMHQGRLQFSFSLAQNATPYALHVPLKFYYPGGTHTLFLDFNQAQQDFVLDLEEAPLRAVLDEDYDLMRGLHDSESLPTLAHVLGAATLIASVPDEGEEIYAPLLDALGANTRVPHTEMNFARLSGQSVLIVGRDNPVAQSLFGNLPTPPEGVHILVKNHPFSANAVIALLTARDSEEAQAAAMKLRHYGGYSELAFNRGDNVHKHTAATLQGIELFRSAPTRALKPAQMVSLEAIVPELAQKNVVFIGEQHSRFEHHLNQWLIIKKLVERGRKVAIAMEMFQQPYQTALDDYLAGSIEESEFLEKSQYFDKWRYDYNLYKIIIDYAKQQKLPLIALNIEGDINRKIGRDGIAALASEERAQLPLAMNFSDVRYREDLRGIFAYHPARGGKQDDKNQAFTHFYQAQTVWDESMAERAARFLEQHPDTLLVVLAGNGHLRYAYGIPQRLYQRVGLPYAVVLQDDELAGDIADFMLLSTPLSGTETPLMGVYVDTQAHGLVVQNVSDGSPAALAGIEKDDVLKTVDGKPVANMADLKIALLYANLEQPIALSVTRGEQTLEMFLNFKATVAHGHYP